MSSMDDYNVQKVRSDFPILHRKVYGKPLVYLDNSASAQKPRSVINAVNNVYENEYANVHRGLHFLSNGVTHSYELARQKIRKFINAPSADQIIFTKGTTEAINLVAYSYAMPRVDVGDEIVLTIMEHHSNIVPWHFLRERQGARLIWVDVDDKGEFSLDDFEASLSNRTKLVAITHMSNVLGTVLPIKNICRIAHERGIKVLIDGAQGAVHMPVDVQDIDCDFYSFTGHKLYGPSGVGVLYGKKEVLDMMRPYQGGGEMIHDVTVDHVDYNELPHRFEAGTPPIVQAIGLGVAVDYIDSLGWKSITVHEADLRDYARQRLREISTLRMIGDASEKGAIFSFELEGIHAHDVSTLIDREGVAVRTGTHCAQPLLNSFKTTSTCRVSFGLYNTHYEVDILVKALEKARAFFI
ncbi:cysteine desulfurase [Candidatus Endowatersipora endosymbiont of Watersipora subatra]|uniref:cysteine desulfurase n=1 Tax=Candidatus Endowatersipora endosymbiont of Watersipora subatra TaxID=3077946 RepID=UPI00312C75B3